MAFADPAWKRHKNLFRAATAAHGAQRQVILINHVLLIVVTRAHGDKPMYDIFPLTYIMQAAAKWIKYEQLYLELGIAPPPKLLNTWL